MTYLIAGVVVVSLIAVLMLIFGKKGGGSSVSGSGEHKSQAQIIRLANKKLAKDPYDPEGLFPIGDIYFSKQLWDKAFPVYMQLSKLPREKLTEEEYFLVLLRYGICAVHQNKFQEAVMSLSEAYNLNSRNFEVNYYLGRACFKSQQYEKAIPCFKKALIAKSDAEGVYFYLGQALYFTKKYRDSLPCFKKALDEDPSNKEALYDMADAMTEEGHGEKAIKVFMHLRPDPVYGSKSCLHAGVYHRKVGDTETAIQDFEIGLKHENALPEVKLEIEYNLAQVYFEKNQVAKGLPLSKPLKDMDVFPTMLVQMVKIGEETGNIEDMMEKVADLYDREVDLATESLTQAMEPLTMVVMACIVGMIVAAVYGPIMSMYDGIDNL